MAAITQGQKHPVEVLPPALVLNITLDALTKFGRFDGAIVPY